MATQQQSTFVSGAVTGVNAKGVQLDGQQWYNLSNYAKDVNTNGVQKGQDVTLRLDGQGFIRAIQAAERVNLPAQSNGVAPAVAAAPVSRDRSIILQTVMKTAGAVNHGQGNPDEFSATADAILEWYDSRISAPTNKQNGVASTEDVEDLPF